MGVLPWSAGSNQLEINLHFSDYCRLGEHLARSLPLMRGARRLRAYKILDKASAVVRLLAIGRSLEEAAKELKIPESQARRALSDLMQAANPKNWKAGTYRDMAAPTPASKSGRRGK